jgi:integrase
MPRLALTDAAIRAIKTPLPGDRLEITDSTCRGLCLRVTDKRAMTWSFMWRDKTADKVRRLTIGPYPETSLRKARELCDGHRSATSRGEDPQADKQTARHEARNFTTFDEVALAYVERYAKVRKASWKNDEGYLRRPRAAWGKRDVRGITRADVVTLLSSIAAEAPISANRTQSMLHKLFTWGADEFNTVNPVAGVERQGGKEQPKERALDAREMRLLWTALDGEQVRIEQPIRCALRTVFLTACRPGEVTGMTTAELHGLDTAEAEWRIPGARTKNRRPHVVPLSPAAVSVIKQALALYPLLDPPPVRAVFASRYDRAGTIARHSASQATRRLKLDNVAPFTPHDLRRSAATLARRGQVRRDVVKALLNHVEGDVTGVYDCYDLLPERRAALEIVAAVVA